MRERAECIRDGLLLITIACLSIGAIARADEPRFNQIQVIGSHNSYHIAPAPAIQQMIVARNPQRAGA